MDASSTTSTSTRTFRPLASSSMLKHVEDGSSGSSLLRSIEHLPTPMATFMLDLSSRQQAHAHRTVSTSPTTFLSSSVVAPTVTSTDGGSDNDFSRGSRECLILPQRCYSTIFFENYVILPYLRLTSTNVPFSRKHLLFTFNTSKRGKDIRSISSNTGLNLRRVRSCKLGSPPAWTHAKTELGCSKLVTKAAERGCCSCQ
ncbi:hypothetical protein CPC08DRAFT_260083 [Agrocybe pediades]|nr:hypothetical protein CPC08DRAFT_260083 [Agrocybe pediades]